MPGLPFAEQEQVQVPAFLPAFLPAFPKQVPAFLPAFSVQVPAFLPAFPKQVQVQVQPLRLGSALSWGSGLQRAQGLGQRLLVLALVAVELGRLQWFQCQGVPLVKWEE